MDQILIREIVLIFIFAFLGGVLARRFKQPAIVGYLFSGIILSLPIFTGLINFDVSRNIAKIGVALLLFTTGLEFPISKFLSIKKSVWLSVIIQLILFLSISVFVFIRLGFTNYESFFLSVAFSNSATIIILQMIVLVHIWNMV